MCWLLSNWPHWQCARESRSLSMPAHKCTGIKEEEQVTEDLELLPISTYNKTKMVAERVLSYAGDMAIHNIRPATVCGLSPRMRLDVSVNMLVFKRWRIKRLRYSAAIKCGPTFIFGIWPGFTSISTHPELPRKLQCGFRKYQHQAVGQNDCLQNGRTDYHDPFE